jgi:hypothetical protein
MCQNRRNHCDRLLTIAKVIMIICIFFIVIYPIIVIDHDKSLCQLKKCTCGSNSQSELWSWSYKLNIYLTINDRYYEFVETHNYTDAGTCFDACQELITSVNTTCYYAKHYAYDTLTTDWNKFAIYKLTMVGTTYSILLVAILTIISIYVVIIRHGEHMEEKMNLIIK